MKKTMIADRNVMEMHRSTAGLEKGASLKGVDLFGGARAWLTAHSMEADKLSALKEKLR